MRIELCDRSARGGTEMDFADPALSNDGFEVVCAEPAAGHDGDLVAGAIDQFREVSIPSRAVGRPPEVNTRSTPRVDQDIEGFQRVRGLVKRLVKSDAKRPGQSDELRGLVAIDGRLAVKTPRTTPAAPSVLATSMSCRMTAISGSE